jgi:hypothetical protein
MSADRRRFLNTLAFAGAGLALRSGRSQQNDLATKTSNGGTDPYPIPWLDQNGSHNQPAAPNSEPSHIYHFRGRVARCSTFTGMGTDNQGNRIAFGTPRVAVSNPAAPTANCTSSGWLVGWAFGGSGRPARKTPGELKPGMHFAPFDLLVDTQAVRCDSLQLQGWPTRIEPGLKPQTQERRSSQESQPVCTKHVHGFSEVTRVAGSLDLR